MLHSIVGMKRQEARKAEWFDGMPHGGVSAPSQLARLTVGGTSRSLQRRVESRTLKKAVMLADPTWLGG